MVKPRFGIEFVPQKHPEKIAKSVAMAEEVGLDYAWITDHYNNRNVYITLTVIAYKTSKIKIGPGVTNPYVINPCWTASAVATLNEISGGRAVLGIGAGDKATLEGIGVSWEKPLTTMREAVTIIRKLLDGEKVSFEGKAFKVKSAKLSYKTETRIPIYIGAQGPKMLVLAGELGDGVLINASSPEDFELAVPAIKEGAQKASRDPSQIDITAYTCFSIDEDRNKAREAAVPVVAFIVAGSPETVLERHGISIEAANKLRECIGKGDFPGAFKLVNENMLETFSIYGTPEDCTGKIEELLKKGVTQVVFGSPLGADKKKAIQLIGEVVKRFK